MPNFLTSAALSSKIESIISNANQEVVIISPYIKLGKLIKRTLDGIKSNPKIRLVVVFGKNQDNLNNSISNEDLEYLKSFPNVQIKHEPDLHAKVYMNEYEIILSSMNLYDYSQQNNIEFGVYGSAKGILGKLTSNLTGESFDEEAVIFFHNVMEKANSIFHKEPRFSEGGIFSKDKYLNSDILVDKKTTTLKPNSNNAIEKKGFCIRTGKKIKFDPKRPFTLKAFESWNRYKDESFPEKFCHYSGEPSNGETSFERPILKKNWKAAMSKT